MPAMTLWICMLWNEAAAGGGAAANSTAPEPIRKIRRTMAFSPFRRKSVEGAKPARRRRINSRDAPHTAAFPWLRRAYGAIVLASRKRRGVEPMRIQPTKRGEGRGAEELARDRLWNGSAFQV